MERGRFIVFEGCEGAGKTTQIQRSLQWLEASDLLKALQQAGACAGVTITREPGGTELGQDIRSLLLHPASTEPMDSRTELLLYAADRAQHVESYLKPRLDAGWLVLCDRYTDSTVAYQGYGRELDLGLIDQLNQIATLGLTSDLTLWLDLDVDIGLARAQRRGRADRMEQADRDFHRRVQSGFQALAKAHPQRMIRVDASPGEDEVQRQIQSLLEHSLRAWYSPFLTP